MHFVIGSNPSFQITTRFHLLSQYVNRSATLPHVQFIWARSTYTSQGRSWYTKWLTVVERSPVVTRFDTREFLDIGGFVNIRLRMDDDKMNGYMYQVIRPCL